MGTHHTDNDTGSDQTLSDHVRDCVEDYFAHLNGHDSSGLYHLVLAEVEKPLLETTLKHCDYNQSKAAIILGLSRSTLRKKLEHYSIG
ncbi:helix-turn-helix domain-containing protein [Methylomonas montana]|uniref:helix-turn-helix domain-containing protein n=1 Tax=Methylomonas montana TaxID=3058963 RepID=UPI00265B2203|nr:helix-turn-helix domain-containing protein [Methylomonas montana]WKJ89442.1 helix-turn-helix domain-containing protein [Methylomonas montana]